jgi:hypothetical protein
MTTHPQPQSDQYEVTISAPTVGDEANCRSGQLCQAEGVMTRLGYLVENLKLESRKFEETETITFCRPEFPKTLAEVEADIGTIFDPTCWKVSSVVKLSA